MAATVQGTAYLVGIGSVAFTNLIPVTYKEETFEVSSVIKDGHGAPAARVIKDTGVRWTVTGNYSTAVPAITEGATVTFTDDTGATIAAHVETTDNERTEDPGTFSFTCVLEASITYTA